MDSSRSGIVPDLLSAVGAANNRSKTVHTGMTVLAGRLDCSGGCGSRPVDQVVHVCVAVQRLLTKLQSPTQTISSAASSFENLTRW